MAGDIRTKLKHVVLASVAEDVEKWRGMCDLKRKYCDGKILNAKRSSIISTQA